MQSCITRVDDVFNESAAERLQAHQVECMDLLTSAKYGWEIRYFPSSSQAYGGFTHVAKFETDGNVALIADPINSVNDLQLEKSHFTVNASSGVVLTFDTYNDGLHLFANPDLNDGSTLEGDYEFAYISGDHSRMVFRGIKSGNTIIFTALDTDMLKHMENVDRIVKAVEADMDARSYALLKWKDSTGTGKVTIAFQGLFNIFIITYADGTTGKAAFVYTTDGIILYRPIEINGITVSGFKWDDTTVPAEPRFVSVDAQTAAGDATTVTLEAAWPDYFMPYDAYPGTYKFAYEDATGNDGTRTVVLAQNVANESYTMTGLFGSEADFSVEVVYNRYMGVLFFTYQLIGSDATYSYHFCPVEEENLGTSEVAGLNAVKDMKAPGTVLTFSDNGVAKTPYTGLALLARSSTGWLYYSKTTYYSFAYTLTKQ